MKTGHTRARGVNRKKWLWLGGGAAAALFLVSCASLNRTLVLPPQIPGATFVGSQECATCHENITKGFPTASHARLMAKGPNAADMGCESCHGPGSLHSQAGGSRTTIINPRNSPEICFQCHLDKRGEFNLPNHHPVLEGKVSCINCHDPHKGKPRWAAAWR